jgi:hypothetical protein
MKLLTFNRTIICLTHLSKELFDLWCWTRIRFLSFGRYIASSIKVYRIGCCWRQNVRLLARSDIHWSIWTFPLFPCDVSQKPWVVWSEFIWYLILMWELALETLLTMSQQRWIVKFISNDNLFVVSKLLSIIRCMWTKASHDPSCERLSVPNRRNCDVT